MISVLMLCYQQVDFMPLAVASALEYEGVEVILVCPSTTDRTIEMAAKLKEIYGARIYIVTKKDDSPAEGLNNALSHASGSIIGVLNADDFYLPGSLKRVSHIFEANPEIDLFLGGGLILDQDSNHVKYVVPSNVKSQNFKLHNLGALTFLHQGMFYRLSKFSELKFNEANRVNWDTEFLYQIMSKNPTTELSDDCFAVFRLSSGNITSNLRNSISKESQGAIFYQQNHTLMQKILGTILRLSKFVHLVHVVIKLQFRKEKYRQRPK